nr:helix-turn-helix domain-containing protein [Streptomyces dysideae]
MPRRSRNVRSPPGTTSSTSVATRSAQKLTVDEICAELQITRSTFYDWRQKGRGPRCIRLPNGALRIRRSDFENWLTDCEDRP